MSMATAKTCCCTCEKQTAILSCAGCLQNFCRHDYNLHLETLNKQFDGIENDHDELRQKLLHQEQSFDKHPLIQHVDRWEEDSIHQIKQIAHDCRQELIKYTKKCMIEIETKLNGVAQEIKQTREDNNFNEIRIKQLEKELAKLNEELQTPPSISIEEEHTSFINKIYINVPFEKDHAEPTSGIKKLIGRWELVAGENFDDYMKALGVGFALRQSAKLLSPTMFIYENEGKWSFKSESTFKSTSYQFIPGVEFDETRLDGENVKSIIQFEDDKWIHTRHAKNVKVSTMIRWVDSQGLQQIEMQCGDVKARRWYKRADY